LRSDVAFVVEGDIHRSAIAYGASVPQTLGVLDQARDSAVAGLLDPRAGFIARE